MVIRESLLGKGGVCGTGKPQEEGGEYTCFAPLARGLARQRREKEAFGGAAEDPYTMPCRSKTPCGLAGGKIAVFWGDCQSPSCPQLRSESIATVETFPLCGELASNFPRFHCPDCAHEKLIPFTCKGRHFCPARHPQKIPLDDDLTLVLEDA